MNGTISQETFQVDWQDWRLSMERVVADLLDVERAYIVLDAELPQSNRDYHFWGMVTSDLARHLRNEIAGRWAGEYPAMILSVDAITRYLRALPRSESEVQETALAMCNGVVAHETAHLVEFQLAQTQSANSSHDVRLMELRRCHCEGEWEFTADEFSEVLHLPNVTRERSRIEHGPQFCRICLHALHRLEAKGIETCLVTAIDYQQIGHPRPAYMMRIALAEELAASIHEPLIEVACKNPPEAFVRLFDVLTEGERL